MWLVLVLIAFLKGWGNYDAFICIPFFLGFLPGLLGCLGPASMEDIPIAVGACKSWCLKTHTANLLLTLCSGDSVLRDHVVFDVVCYLRGR